jgi:hypothetical protein
MGTPLRESVYKNPLVSAWATENRLVFAQVKTEEKHNGITVIPTLLEMIALKGL